MDLAGLNYKAKLLLKIEKEQERLNELIDHFSYHAFDGRTGALRWKHERDDFLESPLRKALKDEIKKKKNSKKDLVSIIFYFF